MCGIAGWLSFLPGAAPVSIQHLLDAQRHRGPDGEGQWSDGNCIIGHRRLAVIDLTAAADQPMPNEDGTIQAVFNGEIYNFGELRKRLETAGHKFRSHGDTEVLVHSYEEWGPQFVDRLRGMFAFAIWDQARRRLILGRDRVGKKPLFYYLDANRLIFASELQGLLAERSIPRAPDFDAIDSYLSWGYIPAPHSGFAGVRKLAPASVLTVEAGSGPSSLAISRYWRLNFSAKAEWTESDAIESLRSKLSEAVRLRLVSDVPLGAFLSGGVDSSIVVGLMAQLSTTVKTFSIGFAEASYDELKHARRIADRWSTEHHEYIVRPDAMEVLPLLVRHYGEPYADSSALPTYYVSQLSHRDVTVVLNGDGGDESFAGYERYRANYVAALVQSVPGSRLAASAIRPLLPDSVDPKNLARRLRRFLNYAGEPQAVRYAHWCGLFGSADKERLYDKAFSKELPTGAAERWMASLFSEVDGVDPAEAAMYVDIESYLPYDLLVKVDIASMANSLEVRSPFLDHEVMELAATFPARMKLRMTNQKRLLKRAFPDLLPPENINRPKMGFGVPVGEWFRGPLRDLLRDALLDPKGLSQNYFRAEELSRLMDDHLSGRDDHTGRLWALLMLEMWNREMLVTH